MAKAAWGEKRVCGDCGSKFYDLKKEPIICAKCGKAFIIASLQTSSRTKIGAPKKRVASKVQSTEGSNEETKNETSDTGFDLIGKEDENLNQETSQIIGDTTNFDEESDELLNIVEDVNEKTKKDVI